MRAVNFLVQQLVNSLNQHYDISIEELLNTAPEKAVKADSSHWFYGDDAKVIGLVRTLNDLGYYKTHELNDHNSLFYPMPVAGHSQLPPLINMILAELRNAPTVADFLQIAVKRTSSMPAHQTWINYHRGRTRLLYEYQLTKRDNIRPQWFVTFLCKELLTNFEMAPKDFVIVFDRHTLLNERAFKSIVGTEADRAGSMTYIEFLREPNLIPNRHANPSIMVNISEAVDQLQSRLYPAKSMIARIVLHLEECIYNQVPFPTHDEIARMVGMSRVTLYRKLQDDKLTYSAICQSVKLQNATQLLADRDLEISDIARRLGFSSPAVFTRFFKTAMNITPSEYRHPDNKRSQGGSSK